jgi:hypothetical protein
MIGVEYWGHAIILKPDPREDHRDFRNRPIEVARASSRIEIWFVLVGGERPAIQGGRDLAWSIFQSDDRNCHALLVTATRQT